MAQSKPTASHRGFAHERGDAPRVLMFAPGFAPYAASENLVNGKLALAMLDRGWQLEVISRRDDGFTYDVGWSDPWRPLQPITHEIHADPPRGLAARAVSRLRDIARVGWPLAGMRWAAAAVEAALQLHRAQPFDLIISRSPSDAAHLAGMAFASRTGLPWIANWNDPPGDFMPPPYNENAGVASGPLYRHFLRTALRRATMNTFPCRRLQDYVLRSLQIEGAISAAIIPHIALASPAFPGRRMGGLFRLCHAGNLSKERTPDAFLAALARFAATPEVRGNVSFEVIGVGAEQAAAAARKHGVESIVKVLGRMSYMDTLAHLAQCDAAVLLEAPCQEGIFLPSKVIDYAQAGAPILAVSPQAGTMSDLLEKHGGGIAAPCGSSDQILAGLQSLHRAWRDGTAAWSPRRLLSLFRPDAVMDCYQSLFEGPCRS